MGSCISRGGGNVIIHDFWYLGKGGMKLTRNKYFLLLTYLRSVLVFITQYSNSMFFSSILAENITDHTLFMWNRRTHTYLLLVLIKNLSQLQRNE